MCYICCYSKKYMGIKKDFKQNISNAPMRVAETTRMLCVGTVPRDQGRVDINCFKQSCIFFVLFLQFWTALNTCIAQGCGRTVFQNSHSFYRLEECSYSFPSLIKMWYSGSVNHYAQLKSSYIFIVRAILLPVPFKGVTDQNCG